MGYRTIFWMSHHFMVLTEITKSRQLFAFSPSAVVYTSPQHLWGAARFWYTFHWYWTLYRCAAVFCLSASCVLLKPFQYFDTIVTLTWLSMLLFLKQWLAMQSDNLQQSNRKTSCDVSAHPLIGWSFSAPSVCTSTYPLGRHRIPTLPPIYHWCTTVCRL